MYNKISDQIKYSYKIATFNKQIQELLVHKYSYSLYEYFDNKPNAPSTQILNILQCKNSE